MGKFPVTIKKRIRRNSAKTLVCKYAICAYFAKSQYSDIYIYIYIYITRKST
jgi:hypothetical protein